MTTDTRGTIPKEVFNNMVTALKTVVATVEDNGDDDPSAACDVAWNVSTDMLAELLRLGLISEV